jgi:hypothetical protein
MRLDGDRVNMVDGGFARDGWLAGVLLVISSRRL